MQPHPRVIQIGRLAAAVALTLGVGTVGFHLILHESWFQAFYRAVVTSTLAVTCPFPGISGSESRRFPYRNVV